MTYSSLLYTDRHTNYKRLSENSEALIADLNLLNIFKAMAEGDPFIFQVSKEVLLIKEKISLHTIVFRQEILSDAIKNRDVFISLYKDLTKCIEEYEAYYNKSVPSFSTFLAVSAVLKDNTVLFRILIDTIQKIKSIIDKNKHSFVSSGICEYFSAFKDFFSEDFLVGVSEQYVEIESLCENMYARLTTGLGGGLKGHNYVLRSVHDSNNKKNNFVFNPAKSKEIALSSIGIHAQAGSLRDAGLSQVSHIFREVNEKTLAYLRSFRYDIGFYIGCINLYCKLRGIGVPVSFPDPKENKSRILAFSNLVDISLAIENAFCPVGNTIDLEELKLLIVTGANQGGKSTFLRSVGCAQLMMQCGMFVSADSYSANCCSNICTHFCRSESEKLDQGRLNEELCRLNEIVNYIDRDSLVLMNESFSSTSEREASSIAQEVIQAFYDMEVRTIFVTHFYEIAKVIQEKNLKATKFLVAQRHADGTRPYTLIPSSPQQTSFGIDIYHEVFGDCI